MSDLKYTCEVKSKQVVQNEYGGNVVSWETEFETHCGLKQEKTTKVSAIGLDINKTYFTVTIKYHPERILNQEKLIQIGNRRFTPIGSGNIVDKYQTILTIEVK